MMMHVARGGGELHDAARARAHHGAPAITTARAVGERAPRADWTPSTTTAPTRWASASIARATRQQRRRPVLPAGARRVLRAARLGARLDCCSCSTACAGTKRCAPAARCGTSWCTATTAGVDSRALDAAHVGLACSRPDRRERFHDVQRLPARSRRRKRAGGATPSLLYFQTFSRTPDPAGYEQPAHPLDVSISAFAARRIRDEAALRDVR